jgi:signal recognition particle subunit SRP54
MPGGFGGGPGGGKRSKGKAGKKGKAKAGRSGNPAKRALEAQGRGAGGPAAGGASAAPGATDPFGFGGTGLPAGDSDDAQDYELPKELRDLLAKGDR